MEIDAVVEIVKYLEDKEFISCVITLSSKISLHAESLQKILKNENRISLSHSSAENRQIIKKNFFTINIPLLTESQQHNTYFNRKVCIDIDGNIKNSPEAAKNFGNIKDTGVIDKIVGNL